MSVGGGPRVLRGVVALQRAAMVLPVLSSPRLRRVGACPRPVTAGSLYPLASFGNSGHARGAERHVDVVQVNHRAVARCGWNPGQKGLVTVKTDLK